ncbi:MAG: discoidin domain-containing protein [Acidobacteriota bacterium]|nr:discoidin domain-containing protein [Acidobacteriota bacterium]
MIRNLAFLLAFSALACQRAEAPATATHAQPSPFTITDQDKDNLLNIARGAAVVSRTAEADLESSALHAMDGMSTTRWATPSGGASQSLTFSFAVPSRVDKLGVLTGATERESPSQIRFEASADGRTYREVLVMNPKVSDEPQIQNVEPFDATHLRVSTVETNKTAAQLTSIFALGRELDAPRFQSMGGCWKINGQPAMLVQHGARIMGVIGGDKVTVVDGGTDGRVARLMWMRGPMWGYAAVTLAPEGNALSGLTFHQNPLTGYVSGAWFGERCNERLEAHGAPPEHFLRRTGQWSLSGLAFDEREQLIESVSRDALDALAHLLTSAPPQQRFAIVAHEFRFARDENLQRTRDRIASLRAALQARNVDLSRIELVASGSDRRDAETVFAVQRLLWSRIDLELR